MSKGTETDMANRDVSISRQDELENIIRKLLMQERVQLWMPPFTTPDGEKGEKPQDLIDRYSAQLGMSPESVELALEQLRQHALEKLNARKKYQQSGLATLKIKVAGAIAIQGSNLFNIEISLDSTGAQLKQMVAEKCTTTTELLKLICCGRIIQETATLSQQHVKNSVTIMAVGTTASASKESESFSKLAKTKEAAELLTQSMDNDDPEEKYRVQIADQTGKPLKLPPEESKALVMAMTLHEKGKSALKKHEFSDALLYLLEADEEFKKCRADILNCVDNYAVLCLDVVWCYLCMKSVTNLPDAESRLLTCEKCFMRSYGANLERLRAVKGEVGEEMALFMRLHLLQGILSFHQGRMDEARQFLRKAETELRTLQVDDDKLTQVMSMGFTHQEARLGLRACEGNVEMTIQHIMQKQQDKKDRREKEKLEKERRKEGKNLGKTHKGKWLDMEGYDSMLSMGFPPGGAREALRLAENDVTVAIQFLQDRPELYDTQDPIPITDDMLSQVASLGFDTDEVRCTLQDVNGDVQKAIDKLLSTQRALTQENITSPTSVTTPTPSPSKSKEERQKEKEAIETLIPDIAQGEEDYLDITLDQESQILAEYMSLISSLKL